MHQLRHDIQVFCYRCPRWIRRGFQRVSLAFLVLIAILLIAFEGLADKTTSVLSPEVWLAGFGVGCIGFLIGIVGNLAASSLEKRLASIERGPTDHLHNHHLAEATGQAIQMIMLMCAEEPDERQQTAANWRYTVQGTDRATTKALAGFARNAWIQICADPDEERRSKYKGILEPNLGEFIKNPKQVSLGRDTWTYFLAEVNQFATRTPIPRAPLNPPSRDIVANALADEFGRSLREALKHAFATGHEAWAAIQLDMHRALLDRTNEIAKDMKDVRASLATLVKTTQRANEKFAERLNELHGAAEKNRKVLLLCHRRVASAYARVNEKLDSILKSLAGGPRLRSLNVPPNKQPGVLFSDRMVACLGRGPEYEQLHAFLESDHDVAWWLWHGPAGVGKTRLIYELCLQLTNDNRAQSGWHAGLLDFETTGRHSWSDWWPNKPTLIVLDYVYSETDRISAWLDQLAQSLEGRGLNKVRLILLERDVEKEFIDRLFSSGDRRRWIERICYAAPRELTPLEDTAAWEIFNDFYRRRNAAVPQGQSQVRLPDQQVALRPFRTGQIEYRPLFICLAADATYRGKDVHEWDQSTLVTEVLREERARWEKDAKEHEWSKADLQGAETLIALSTLAGGLQCTKGYGDIYEKVKTSNANIATLLPDPKLLLRGPGLIKDMLSLGDHPSFEQIPPLRPDYIGEVFLLEYVASLQYGDLPGAFLEVAITLNGSSVAEVVARCAKDFASHEGLRRLLDVLMENATSDEESVFGPGTRLAEYDLGLYLEHAGFLNEAVVFFRRAIKNNVRRVAAHLSLSNVFRRLAAKPKDDWPVGKTHRDLYRDIELHSRQAIAINPNIGVAHFILACCLVDVREKGPEFWPIGKNAEALDAEAVTEYRRATELDPSFTASHYNLANLLRELADKGPDYWPCRDDGTVEKDDKALYTEAVTEYRKALELNPTDAATRTNLAFLLEKLADKGPDYWPCRDDGTVEKDDKALYTEAVTEYRKAIELNPSDAIAHNNLANRLVQLADNGPDYWPCRDDGTIEKDDKALYTEAVTEYRKALKVDPSYANAHNNLASLLMMLADKGPDYWPCRDDGTVENDEALYTEAVKAYRKAIDVGTSHPLVHNNLAILLVKLADKRCEHLSLQRERSDLYNEAEDRFRLAAQLRPQDPNILVNWAWLKLGNGEFNEGIKVIQQAIRFLDRLPNPGETNVEAYFYIHALGPVQEQNNALRRLRQLIVGVGVRSPGWSFDRVIAQVRSKDENRANWLNKLAAVIAEGASPNTLDEWVAWRNAG